MISNIAFWFGRRFIRFSAWKEERDASAGHWS